jgi:putative ABC transport system permease protein
MKAHHLVSRSLRHYWRTNVAVAAGVAVAVATLAGALVVGESVRASLRDLALARLGRADYVVTGTTLFTEQLGARLAAARAFKANWSGAVPLLALEGTVVHERSGTRAGRVQVYGVDDRFWTFNAVDGVAGPAARAAYLSAALARELGAADGDALLLRVQRPSAIPAGLIQGRRDEPGRGVRLAAARVLTREQLGEFSPRPQQGPSRTLFVPLDRLQRDLDLPHRANVLLVAGRPGADPAGLQALVGATADFTDYGVRVREITDTRSAVESEAGLISPALEQSVAAAGRELGASPRPILTYLATSIRANGRETPYSMVAAIPDPGSWIRDAGSGQQGEATPGRQTSHGGPRIWLTAWLAEDLAAKTGDEVTLEYYLWSDAEGLRTGSATFTVAGVNSALYEPALTPEYPGISSSAHIADWDPPFPVDLKRVRPKDEAFWEQYRAAPKAFVAIDDGRRLWSSQYGSTSSYWIDAPRPDVNRALAHHLSPGIAGFQWVPVRRQALDAAAGTTDFGEYFTYFSFFLVVSSLLLTVLFFRLGIEQRAREVGLLAAMGYTQRTIRSLLLGEGAVLAIAGAIAGMAGALAYSWLIMFALRTWWIDAVGTSDLRLHAAASALLAGAVGGIVAGLACLAWSLRVLRRSSPRELMSGAWVDEANTSTTDTTHREGVRTVRGVRAFRDPRTVAALLIVSALGLLLAGFADAVAPAAAFFGAGALLLVAGLCALAAWLRGTSRQAFVAGPWPVGRLGLRNARYRPSRSVLSVALIASATFLIVSVGAFRRGVDDVADTRSGTGGYTLVGETLAPLMHDPATPAGRAALNLGPELDGLSIARFRLRPGDDASCLNLYRPQSPRILGATDTFMRANRFSFAGVAPNVEAQPAEIDNPWLLLNREFKDGSVPVIGDATSLTYVFHLGVGDVYAMQGPDGRPLRLRIVGALRDSVLQSELVMGDAHFTRLFPRNEGFRVFLVEAPTPRASAAAAALEDQLQDFGMDVQSTSERLASYHRVENTYLSTFQALGALGLVLGTFGLGTVLLRNVLERRRELALLRATGYQRGHLAQMVLAESLFLLACGLTLGIVCAAIAIAPAWVPRAQSFPVLPTIGLLGAVLAAGLLSTLAATRVAARSPLLEALKNE